MKYKNLIFLVLFLILSFQAAQSTEEKLSGFCFPPTANLDVIKKSLNPILLPRDKVYFRRSVNCIEIKLSKPRMGLFVTYLERHFNVTETYWGKEAHTSDITRSFKQCRVEIIEEVQSEVTSTKGALGQKASLGSQHENKKKNRRSVLVLGEGMPGNLRINDHSVDLICFLKSNENAEIVVRLQGQTRGLSTTLRVKKGIKNNLGDIVQDLVFKNKSASIKNGIKLEQKKDVETTRFFMIFF